MLSPAKAITAGALVFALGGVVLMAQSFDQQGDSVPGAATDAEPVAPVEFTSKAWFSGQVGRGETNEVAPGHDRLTGEAWKFRFSETSDPRVDGTIINATTIDTHSGGDVEVSMDAYRIENEGGAWQEVPMFFIRFRGQPLGRIITGAVTPHVFIGEDEYEGLVVVAEETWTGSGFELHGFIIEGGLPVAPEPWSAE